MRGPHTNEGTVRAEERRSRVAELVLNGYSERAIAARVGVSHQQIHKDVVAIRTEWRRARNDTYDLHVGVQMARLDQLERVIARRLAEGDLNAVDRALKILERRARLLGLDAPARHDVRIEDPISAEIRDLAERLGVTDDPAVRQALAGSSAIYDPIIGDTDDDV